MTPTADCPYCSAPLPKVPRRRTPCRTCKQPIIVRARQTVFASPLLTEEQAWAADAYTEIAGWRPGLFDMATGEWEGSAGYEWLPDLAAEMLEQLRTAARERRPLLPLLTDYGRSVADRFPPHYAKSPYWSLARLLARAGQPSLELARRARQIELEAQRDAVPGMRWTVEIMTALPGGRRCPACSANAGRRMPLEQALEEMPLPCAGCSCSYHDGVQGFCACVYLFERQ